MICFEHFSFTYENGDFGIHDIDLSIQSGECVVLTGPSGCGKTTMLRCINGLIPDFYEGEIQGHCTVCNLDIVTHETGDFASKAGSVFQDPRSQFFTMHVRTELPFPSENLGIPQNIIQKNMTQAVSELSLAPLLSHSIFSLSSGEKQKVAIASVYVAGVEIYVLDEPSANLDRDGTEQLRQMLLYLKAQGKTIVISEHKLYYLRELADRVVCMKNGRIKKIYENADFSSLSEEELTSNGLRQLDLSKISCNVPDIKTKDIPVVLEADHLSFHYAGEKNLWQQVSFSCMGGEIVGIVGKNGAGKTTLCRVLMGLEKPASGKIRINQKAASKQQRRRHSFYVMQDVDYQLIAGNVYNELLAGHEKEPDSHTQITQLLKKFSLDDHIKSHPSTLSGGQKQRLSIALACMSNKKILFFDEPTSGLDAKNMEFVRKMILQQAGNGCLCFVISHDYEFAARLFTSLLVIKQEGTVQLIAPQDYNPSQLEKYYL